MEMQELMARVADLAAKSTGFAMALQDLVTQGEKELKNAEYRAAQVKRIAESPAGAEFQAVVRVRDNALYVGARDMVPDVYETLERCGLVSCEFGAAELNGLRSRTIRITEAGIALVRSVDTAVAK